MGNNIKKDIHNIHDKSYKDLYSKKEIALDLFRNLENRDWTNSISKENLILVNKSFISSGYEELESDIVYKAEIQDTEIYFYILLEFQSSVDYTMPLRLFFYISEILKEHCIAAKYKKYGKHIKIPAIVPIVLYNGTKKWDSPCEFRDIVNHKELFSNNIINFKYELFDISNDKKYSKENLLAAKNITSAIFLLEQKVDPKEYLDRIASIALQFNSLSETELRAIKHWIKNTIKDDIAEVAITILEEDKKEVKNLVARNALMLEEMKELAKSEGLKEGKIITLEKLLFKKFKGLTEEDLTSICSLSEQTIDNIIINIFDINTLDELRKFIY